MKQELVIILCFMAAASLLGIILMIYDKIAAKAARRHRVPEAVLVTVAACGGALPMYLIMQIIRHKTRKPKFSVGFPVIIIVQAAVLLVLKFVILV